MKKEITAIRARNKRVEADKAWETSLFRRGFITLITYLIAVWFMNSIGVSRAWSNALVPTGGYVLSTLTLPILKRWWVENRYGRN